MLTDAELMDVGREAAEGAAGPGALDISVSVGEDDDDRPTYLFSFLIDQARARQEPGLLRIRLIQRLRDALLARGDLSYPLVRVLDEADWERRSVA